MTGTAATVTPALTLPAHLAEAEPPEARGLRRDAVRLMVATPDSLQHTTFGRLGDFLHPADLLVINTSSTRAAAVDAQREDGRAAVLHVATLLDDGCWVVELREPNGAGPQRDGVTGERLAAQGGVAVILVAPHDAPATAAARLWRARIDTRDGVSAWLERNGRPIRYGHTRTSWPLSMYQTVFAREPGSAEMPSAGRPFTGELVAQLVALGVGFTNVVLHAGLSSPEAGEPPQAERFRVPLHAARRINETHAAGGRVLAVGTTVTRALETVARADGTVTAAEGWTNLVLSPDRPARVVDGLLTGWHEPGASHLLLLEAVAGPALVRTAYTEALAHGYHWHEFGDACLLLPPRRS